MKSLQVKLLGAPEFLLDGQPVVEFRTGKAQALLCYLAVTARPHTRSALATLLWGDFSDANARVSLSKALSNLRTMLGDFLLVRRDLITLENPDNLGVDVITFKRYCQTATALRSRTEQLHNALNLYRGPFLDGFSVRNAPDFELWMAGERQRLHDDAVQALHEMIGTYEARGNVPQAIAITRRLLTLEPWREEAHSTLMRLLAQTGQRSSALAQYEECCATLAIELGVEPSADTQALYARIVAADILPQPESIRLSRSSGHATSGRFIAGPPITEPRHFFGRVQELTRIFHWLQGQPMTHVAVIGRRRSGKTSLLHYLRTISTSPASSLRPGQKRDWLSEPHNYRWIWVDFQDVRLRREETLLRHLLAGCGLPTPTPCTLETFMDVVTDCDWSQPTVVLMDEVGAALQASGLSQAFWWALRSLVSYATEGRLAFVLAAHDALARLAEDSGKTSPFFNIFNTLHLGPFTQDEASSLIESSPLPFSGQDRTWILEQSQCWPFLVQILCDERLMAMERAAAGDQWRTLALERLQPFRSLFELANP